MSTFQVTIDMIRWKLAEIMARYKITSKALANALKLSPTSVSNMKNSSYLPELGSDRICQVSKALTDLSGTRITPFDLMEFIEN